MRRPAVEPYIDALMADPAPPWHPVTSRTLSRQLGVSLQVLANWRVRDVGPRHERAPRGAGNKMVYRPDVVAAWLTEGRSKPWEFSAKWLRMRGLSPAAWGETATDELVARLELLEVFETRW